MNRMIEVIYEGNRFEPVTPIKGLPQKGKAWLIICSSADKQGLETLMGSLSPQEAEEMQNCIDTEFSKIEGEW